MKVPSTAGPQHEPTMPRLRDPVYEIGMLDVRILLDVLTQLFRRGLHLADVVLVG